MPVVRQRGQQQPLQRRRGRGGGSGLLGLGGGSGSGNGKQHSSHPPRPFCMIPVNGNVSMLILVACLFAVGVVVLKVDDDSIGGGRHSNHNNNNNNNFEHRHLSSSTSSLFEDSSPSTTSTALLRQKVEERLHSENEEENEHDVGGQRRRRLPPTLLDDIEIISHFGSGSINVVFECNILNEEWWAYQNSLPSERRRFTRHKTRFLLKVTNNIEYGRREYNAMNVMTQEIERSYHDHHNVVGLLPLLAGAYNVTSPFHTGQLSLKQLDPTKESKYIRRYTDKSDPNYGRLVMLLVEDASQNMAGYVYDEGLLDTLPKIRIFMKSILQQMQHAWHVGVNNLDLSGNRNVYVDKDLNAILFDWNGWVDIGEPIFDPDYNFDLVPPEAWVQDMDGCTIKVTKETIHSFDVWSIGIMLARLLYAPNCKWSNGQSYGSRKQRLAQHILSLGIHEYDPTSERLPQFWVPVGGGGSSDSNTKSVDMVKVAGLTKEQFQKKYDETIGKESTGDSVGQRYRTNRRTTTTTKEQQDDEKEEHGGGGMFYPTLSLKNKMQKVCLPAEQSFFVLDDPSVETEDVEIVVDLLRRMMTLEPTKRPNYDQLLEHPFFDDVTTTTSSSSSSQQQQQQQQ
eukprot:CAMPEP_0113492160 /NCGR_PEP_ID=MMETSP0014_2-20120614/27928_1 /TAXON_ID=2857 /ORGANISM="Nitzschia sp." /LENGTH=622 /DNA_ID=CAMNT_0000385973 /DNA_START=71 /DNA_END=1939 /DNA_ORIENTATION=- /assembly_acc=CAM_ASM_000159